MRWNKLCFGLAIFLIAAFVTHQCVGEGQYTLDMCRNTNPSTKFLDSEYERKLKWMCICIYVTPEHPNQMGL